jgi:hypothetical protein
MGEDRFNALLLLYVNKDIEIDISKVKFNKNIQNKKNESFLEQMLANWKTYSYIYTIVSR